MLKTILPLLLALVLLLTACSISFNWTPANEEQKTGSILEVIFQKKTETPDNPAPGEAPKETKPEETKPTETTVPPTQAPTEPAVSEDELLKLSNDAIVYGPGTASEGKVPPYAPGAQELYGKYDAHFIEDADNIIYLTFDCGYEFYADGKSVTGMILDVLKEKNVKAVFFVTGPYVENNPQLVQRMLDEGHALGNHSADHKQMPTLTLEEMEETILKLHNTVKDKFGYTMKFFRPPDGAFSLRSLALTQNLGYETVHWSFAYADWNTADQPDPELAKEKILSSHHDGAIYLLHAISTTNAQVLGDVIDSLRDMGYRLDQLK